MSDIILITHPISKEALIQKAQERFGNMVKGVTDMETGTLALGGELHADQEALLIEQGHTQETLWGINIYIEESFPNNIEFDSVVNIRPSQNNRSRNVESLVIREKILSILKRLLPWRYLSIKI